MAHSVREKLERFYAAFNSSDHVLIAINADPDAIASAMAVKRLLWRKVAEITISHINVIKRPDNLAMIRLLGVSLTPWARFDQSTYNRVVMVDSQPSHHPAFSDLALDVLIDHHPITDVYACFKDIRPDYGATSTILTEYIRTAKIRPSAKLAAGLFYGIKTDTSNFERQALMEDVRAFQFLFRYTNAHLIRKIEYAEIRFDFLKYYQTAISNMRLRKGRVFIHLGSVISPDVCVLIADFFMRVNRVAYSIVSGVCGGNLVLILRNDGLRKNAGKLAKRCFGDFGHAGGHTSMARAEILLSDLPSEVSVKNHKNVSNWIIRRIEKPSKRKNQGKGS
jgi:nanoRNase/pAp phosphatase (c-di-AMP/oligoRNAs hydrolase)